MVTAIPGVWPRPRSPIAKKGLLRRAAQQFAVAPSAVDWAANGATIGVFGPLPTPAVVDGHSTA